MARIGVIGAGAVGGYYGALLARAGNDVHFLMRRDLEAVCATGLRVCSPNGDFHLGAVQAHATPASIGPCEWVICSLKATAIDEAEALVRPCMGAGTRVVALMNGLGIEDRFAAWFGGERVYGGMAFVCINRGEPGVIHHLDYGRVTIAHALDDADALGELQALFQQASIETLAAPSLLKARWEKLCWNVPFNGMSVAAGGVGTQTILGDEALRVATEAVMREVVATGNADLETTGETARIDGPAMVGAMFAQTESMGDYRTSMAIDYVNGRPLEVEAILGEPVRRAARLGVATPAMSTLYAAVRAADRRVRGELRPFPPELPATQR